MIPEVKYDKNASLETNLKAIVNWLNFALKEITTGRVPANAEEAARNLADTKVEIEALENAMCEADIATEEWRAEIENALCELDEGV